MYSYAVYVLICCVCMHMHCMYSYTVYACICTVCTHMLCMHAYALYVLICCVCTHSVPLGSDLGPGIYINIIAVDFEQLAIRVVVDIFLVMSVLDWCVAIQHG